MPPELIRLIANSRPDDVLLIEQVDRLSRLKRAIGKSSAPILTPSKSVSLRSIFRQVGCWGVRPTTSPGACSRALNSRMLDMLAAIARKHYNDRRRRQAQGVAAKAKAEVKYRGRPEDIGRNAGIASMLRDGSS